MLDREKQSLMKEEIRITETITEFANNETMEALYKIKMVVEEIEDVRKLYEEFIDNK